MLRLFVNEIYLRLAESFARLGTSILRVTTPAMRGGDSGSAGSTIVRILYGLPVSYLILGWLCVLQPHSAQAASIPNHELDPVTADLAAGRADDAISRLNLSLSTQPGDAEAHNLLCRVYYQEQRWDDAIHQCEAAVQLASLDSGYHLWLGRAYGEKADSIHSIKAYGLAKKVHSEFERAVQLDSKNVDALSDLGEFYTAAPGIVGGGKNKAQGVVQALAPLEPTQGHQLEGLLAEKDKNYRVAEAEFKAAVETSHQSPDAWMALASYYARRKQSDQMLEALHAGIDADAKSAKPHGPALVDGAGILSRSHQELQLATQLLTLYLASPNQSADAPAFQVHAKLSRLLEQQGDHAGAQQHIEAAAALAHDYHPAAPKADGG
jgi:Tetratricopeptide repeat